MIKYLINRRIRISNKKINYIKYRINKNMIQITNNKMTNK